MMIAKRRVIVALQYIRGLAALLVVIDHALSTLVAKAGRELDLAWAWHLGDLGVAVFFVISGAVMVMGHYRDFGREGQVRAFVLKRLVRILPLYWLTSSIYVAKLRWQGAVDPWDVFLSLLFIPHAGGDRVYGRPIYELGWTLQYEMFFYAVFAVALLLNRRKGLIFISAIMLGGVAGVAAMNAPEGSLPYLLKPIVLYFVVGMVIGYMHRRLSERPGYKMPISTDVAMAVGSAILLLDAIFWKTLHQAGLEHEAAVLCAVCAISAVTVATMTAPSAANHILARLGVWLGDITYALYLTHSFVLGPAGKVADTHLAALPSSVLVMLMTVMALPLAHLTYVWVEKPLMARAGKYFFPQRPMSAGFTLKS